MPTVPVPTASPSDEHPPARWRLPDRPDLERLRKQAKKLRRRAAAGDADALELVAAYDPGDEPVTLARAQRVLARAYGFAGWSRLREHLAVLEVWGRDMDSSRASDDPVDAFLRLACLSYTDPYVVGSRGRAAADRAVPGHGDRGDDGRVRGVGCPAGPARP